MKDLEIEPVIKPHSQLKKEEKINPKDLKEDSIFEKKLKTSQNKIGNRKKPDSLDLETINLVSQFIQGLKAENNSFMIKSSQNAYKDGFEKDLSEYKVSQTSFDLNSPKQIKDTPAGKEAQTEKIQQKTLEQIIAYIDKNGLPIPMSIFIEKLQSNSQILNFDIKEIAEKIVEKANLIKINGKTELALTLKPDWLGEIKIKISSKDGVLSIQLLSSNQNAKDIIEEQLEELKNLLASNNLNIGSLNVSVNSNRNNNNFLSNELNSLNNNLPQLSEIIPPLIKNYSTSDNFINLAMNMRKLLIYSKV